MARPSCLSNLTLLFIALLYSGVDVSNGETCACEAEATGFSIDCGNTDAMLAALPLLQANDCTMDCSSDICRKNYFVIQAHHDYCLEGNVPEAVENGHVIYQDSCEDCEITRRPDPSLPVCPQANCDDNSGNTAYQELIAQGCDESCSTPGCGVYYRILRAVHDSCLEGALDRQAEFGIHDFEGPCEGQNCNVGESSFSQLVCNKETSASPFVSLHFFTLVVAASTTAFFDSALLNFT